MELTWVNGSNSWFWIKAEGKNIHIDPAYFPKGHARGPEMDRKADLILITHSHMDHFQPKTVEQLRDDHTIIIGPPKVAKKRAPFKTTIAEPGKELDLGFAKVRPVYAYNLGLKGHIFHKKDACVGYLLTIGGKTIYHAGDTEFIPEMKDLGHVDLAMLPIGGRVTMDAGAAAEAARAIGTARVVPMHNRSTPISELKVMLEKDPAIEVILVEKGKAFDPF